MTCCVVPAVSKGLGVKRPRRGHLEEEEEVLAQGPSRCRCCSPVWAHAWVLWRCMCRSPVLCGRMRGCCVVAFGRGRWLAGAAPPHAMAANQARLGSQDKHHNSCLPVPCLAWHPVQWPSN